jgi:two-component sensor histidine kinase
VRSLAEGELGPFLPPPSPAAPRRIELDGPDLVLQPAAAQALSMTLHELATNATKYGALAGPEGHVRLCWRIDEPEGMLRLRWAERGGPPVAAPPTRRGFGSRVIEATVRDQLNGRLERRWEAGGLVVEARIPLARALAGHAEGEAPRELAAPLPGA